MHRFISEISILDGRCNNHIFIRAIGFASAIGYLSALLCHWNKTPILSRPGKSLEEVLSMSWARKWTKDSRRSPRSIPQESSHGQPTTMFDGISAIPAEIIFLSRSWWYFVVSLMRIMVALANDYRRPDDLQAELSSQQPHFPHCLILSARECKFICPFMIKL
jgi:hypothetical protein